MAFAYNAVADWIAGLTITGVTVKSTNAIPESVQPMQAPLLAPDPVGFVGEMAVTRLSGRVGTARAYQVEYVLTYILYYAPVAAGVSLFTGYRGMLDKLSAIDVAIMANETPSGAYDIRPYGTPAVGPVQDETGTVYHGARIAFLVQEFN